MRTPLIVSLALLLALLTACAEGGLAEPIALPPVLPSVTPPPTSSPQPAATELPTPTAEIPAADIPTNTPLSPATELPTSTRMPAVGNAPAATELPTAGPAPTAAILPAIEPAADPSQPSVTIGNTTWPVELAITPSERAQGLSGREVLPEGTGMLFIFEGDQHLAFWMPDMNFPLDMVWIDSECNVVDATLNAPVPEPGQGLVDLPRFSPAVPARFVLEINAGEFEGAGLSAGARAVFGGALDNQYGC